MAPPTTCTRQGVVADEDDALVVELRPKLRTECAAVEPWGQSPPPPPAVLPETMLQRISSTTRCGGGGPMVVPHLIAHRDPGHAEAGHARHRKGRFYSEAHGPKSA